MDTTMNTQRIVIFISHARVIRWRVAAAGLLCWLAAKLIRGAYHIEYL